MCFPIRVDPQKGIPHGRCITVSSQSQLAERYAYHIHAVSDSTAVTIERRIQLDENP